MRLPRESTESLKFGKTYGRHSLPLMIVASRTPEKRLNRHNQRHIPSLQLGVSGRRRTYVRNSSSLASCVPNKGAKLDESPSHDSDTQIESDLPSQSNSDCESEDRDPLAISPAEETARVTSTRDQTIVLQLSEDLVKDLLSTPEDQKISLDWDDQKCKSIKKNLFGGSTPYDFRVPPVAKPNSNKKQIPINAKSPTISQQGSFSYDSDMDMLSDVSKLSFETPKFHFEPTETINEYPSLSRSMGNNEMITEILESYVANENKQNELKCIVDKPLTVTRRKGGRRRKAQPRIAKTLAKTSVRQCARVARQNFQCTSEVDDDVNDETYSNCRRSNRAKTPNRRKVPVRKSAQVAQEKIRSKSDDYDDDVSNDETSRSSHRPQTRERTSARKSAAVAGKNSQCTSSDDDDDHGIVNNRRPTKRAAQRKKLRIQSVTSNDSNENADDTQSINHEKIQTDSDPSASDLDSSCIFSGTDATYIDIEAEVTDSLFIDNTIIDEMSKLRVMPDEDVVPQHLLESGLTRPPKAEIYRAFVEYVPIKQGKFSAKETEIIKSNWRRFCKIHEWDPAVIAPFLRMQFRGKFLMPRQVDRQNFLRYLGKGLPSRTLFSVLMHFRKIFQPDDGRLEYTFVEDQTIMAYLKDGFDQDRCRKLSLILKHSQRSILQRLKFLRQKAKGNMPTNNVEWNLEISQKFVTNLMELTLTKDIRDLEGELIPKIVWIELEKRLGIPHKNLHDFWYQQLHLQLYCPRPIYENDLKIMLIEYMHVRGITRRKELNWAKVAEHFPGVTSLYLWTLYCRMITGSSFEKSMYASDIGDMIEWMYTTKIPKIIESPDDRYLPRLQYKDGNLVVLDDGQ